MIELNTSNEFFVLNDERVLYIPDDINISKVYQQYGDVVAINEIRNIVFQESEIANGPRLIKIENDLYNYKVNGHEFQTDVAYRIEFQDGSINFLLLHPTETQVYVVPYNGRYELI